MRDVQDSMLHWFRERSWKLTRVQRRQTFRHRLVKFETHEQKNAWSMKLWGYAKEQDVLLQESDDVDQKLNLREDGLGNCCGMRQNTRDVQIDLVKCSLGRWMKWLTAERLTDGLAECYCRDSLFVRCYCLKTLKKVNTYAHRCHWKVVNTCFNSVW